MHLGSTKFRRTLRRQLQFDRTKVQLWNLVLAKAQLWNLVLDSSACVHLGSTKFRRFPHPYPPTSARRFPHPYPPISADISLVLGTPTKYPSYGLPTKYPSYGLPIHIRKWSNYRYPKTKIWRATWPRRLALTSTELRVLIFILVSVTHVHTVDS
jgi:hypothetical protein